MTICASVKVRDGLVLATDSMAQIQVKAPDGQIAAVKTYSNARKLFNLRDLPIGVMSYGLGNIGHRSIQGLVDDFSEECQGNDLQAATSQLFRFIKRAYDAEFASMQPGNLPAVGFYVAGYSTGKVFAEEWEFLLPRDTAPIAARPETTFGASWRGVSIPFSRLYKGYDPRLQQRLAGLGLHMEKVNSMLAEFESPVVYDAMPVQDAINFATYIVRVTIGLSNFEAGAPSCGGPIQLATISKDKGFGWIAEPKLTVQSP